MRKKTVWLADTAILSAADIANTQSLQTHACQLVKIDEPVVLSRRNECMACRFVVPNEGIAHFRTDFVSSRARRRAHPGHDVGRLVEHRMHRIFQHAIDQATPAGMCGRDLSAMAIAKQDGETICREHGQDSVLPGAYRCVGNRFVAQEITGRFRRLVESQNLDTVHLPQPMRPARQGKFRLQQLSILLDQNRIIALIAVTVAKIQSIERRL